MNLHLGCWHREIPGFINVDLCDFPHIHYKNSIDDLSMFRDNSVDLIYSSHSLEYFDRTEVFNVLTEWSRVLKTGGTLRIAVPDFEALSSLYDEKKDISLILGPLYGAMTIKTSTGEKKLYHKICYDFVSLKSTLENASFHSVRRYDWKNTIHKDYDDHSQAYFPHFDKENGKLLSLNIEATK
ncbi:MAG: methyltransferase domain-containing protein [Paracoccaceae bacterium]|jgi:ubiquinone/menaquinone biosynthesis C-methylase UbiE